LGLLGLLQPLNASAGDPVKKIKTRVMCGEVTTAEQTTTLAIISS